MTRPTRASSKVRVITDPVAQRFADEKIIEYSSPNGGGLIAFLLREDKLILEPYRHDDTVQVRLPEPADLLTALRQAEDALVVADRFTGPGTLGENAVRDLLYRVREVIDGATDNDPDDHPDDDDVPEG